VGLGNYADMLSDPAFRSSMLTFVVFAAFIVPTTFALGAGRGAQRDQRLGDALPKLVASGRVAWDR
jgi:ABC-type sugar transport system permease subunit